MATAKSAWAALAISCCLSDLNSGSLPPRQLRQVASGWNREPVPFFYGVDHEAALLAVVADAGLTAGASDLPEIVSGLREETQSKPWRWLQVRVHLILIDLNMGRLREAAFNATVLRKEMHASISRRPVPAWAAASPAEHAAAAETSRELLPTVMQAELYLWAELRTTNLDEVAQLATGIGRTVTSDTTGAYVALPLLPLRAAQMLETMTHGRPPDSKLQADIAALWRAAAGGVLGTGDVMKLALVSSTGRPYQRAVRANGGPTTETVRTDYSAKDARSAWHAHAGDGGWMHQRPEPKRTETDTICDIDRRSNLTTAELLRDYVNHGRPVLVRGLLDGWPLNRWTRSSMLSRRGNHSVLVRSSDFIAAARSTGGFRSADAAAGGTSMLLREFMSVDTGEEDETNKGYVFTSESDLVKAEEDYFHPPLFADHSSPSSVLPWTASERESKAIFFYGKHGSGVGFHHHSNALNALLFGRKRWFLSPLHTFHGPWGGPIKGYLELLQHGNLPSHPIRCVQEAGEVLFVPTGWEHATINEEESIGIAMEMGDEPEQSLSLLLSGGKQKVKTRKRKRRSGL